MTSKTRACPYCQSHNIHVWALGKLKCDDCQSVFKRSEALEEKYVPKTRRPTRTISDRQEKANAKAVEGRRTIASGSTPVDKGDVKAGDVRMECKSTGHASYRLRKEELEKIASQAKDDEIPVFTIEFRGSPSKKEYCVLQKDWFIELLRAFRDRNNR